MHSRREALWSSQGLPGWKWRDSVWWVLTMPVIPTSHQTSSHYVLPNGLKMCMNTVWCSIKFLDGLQTSWIGKDVQNFKPVHKFGRTWWECCENVVRTTSYTFHGCLASVNIIPKPAGTRGSHPHIKPNLYHNHFPGKFKIAHARPNSSTLYKLLVLKWIYRCL